MATLLERIRAIRVMGGHFRLFFGDVDSGVRASKPSLDEAEKALAAVVDMTGQRDEAPPPTADLTARVAVTEDLFACLVDYGCEHFFVDLETSRSMANSVGSRALADSICHEWRDQKVRVVRIVPADAPVVDIAALTARVAELEALVREGGRKLLRSAYNDDCALGAKLLQAVNGPPVPAEMGDC